MDHDHLAPFLAHARVNFMNINKDQKIAILLGGAFIVLVLAAFILTSGCMESKPGERVAALEQQQTPVIQQSNERAIFLGYLNQVSNPNNIQWVYCVSDTGSILFRSAVKGKVISATKSSEPYERIDIGTSSSGLEDQAARALPGYKPGTNQLMNPSGMYGHDMEGCIWMNPEGQYFEWHGKYFVSDAPMALKEPVLTTSNIDLEELNKYKPAAAATA